MSRTLALADMHLMPGDRPEQNRDLAAFLEGPGAEAERIVLLGDTFHCWYERDGRIVGAYDEVLRLFGRAAERGTSLHHVIGNRDFAIGAARGPEGWRGYYAPVGLQAPSRLVRHGIEPHGLRYVFDQGGLRVHGLHGDIFCTRDRLYLALRWILQGPVGRTVARRIPFALAAVIVGALQQRSIHYGVHVPESRGRMQEEPAGREVAAGADVVLCGHAHAERRTPVTGGGRQGELLVAPAWSTERRYVRMDGSDIRVVPFASAGTGNPPPAVG